MTGQSFFEGYLFFIALTLISVLSGLALKLLTLALGIEKLQKRVLVIDEVIGQLLLREGFLQTFTRICLWNILVSFIIIFSGAITVGVLPIVWAFLNLGLFSPDMGLFKIHLHPWIEEAANILSVALGAWIGQNLNEFPTVFPVFAGMIISIFGLYAFSALLETLKIHHG